MCLPVNTRGVKNSFPSDKSHSPTKNNKKQDLTAWLNRKSSKVLFVRMKASGINNTFLMHVNTPDQYNGYLNPI